MSSLTTHWAYFFSLCLSIAGLSLVDFRYNLIWWYDRRAAGLSIGLTWLMLLLADIAGLIGQIFSTNRSFVSGLYFISPDMPIEELLFLYLFVYVCLLSVRIEQRLMTRV